MLELDKIRCMDCLEGMKEMEDNIVDAVITDPPYNVRKNSWDRMDNYHDWLITVLKECQRVLKNNGTLWFFHINFKVLAALHNRIVNETNFRHKQMIVIDKGLQSIAGRTSKYLRSYPRATEYLQFYTFDDRTWAEQLRNTPAKVNPFAKYLSEEFNRAGVSNREIAKLFPSRTGGVTGCVSNWLLSYSCPTKEQYLRMRKFLNYKYLRKEYEDLQKEYKDLQKDHNDLRYTFNLQKGYTDVWRYNFYKENNNGHPACKPISLMRRIIKTATKKEDVVLDPFMGGGSTAIACRQINRHYIGFEVNQTYCDLANKQLSNLPTSLDSFLE